jgi:hypothetical protein
LASSTEQTQKKRGKKMKKKTIKYALLYLLDASGENEGIEFFDSVEDLIKYGLDSGFCDSLEESRFFFDAALCPSYDIERDCFIVDLR